MSFKSNSYQQQNLISNIDLLANLTDSNVINSWGSVIYKGLLYVCQNGSGVVTVHNLKTGQILGNPLLVQDGAPTGIVVNLTQGFVIGNSTIKRPAILIVVTENGEIQGWNPEIEENVFINVFTGEGKVFKGVELINDELHVCNFNSGMIEVYNN